MVIHTPHECSSPSAQPMFLLHSLKLTVRPWKMDGFSRGSYFPLGASWVYFQGRILLLFVSGRGPFSCQTSQWHLHRDGPLARSKRGWWNPQWKRSHIPPNGKAGKSSTGGVICYFPGRYPRKIVGWMMKFPFSMVPFQCIFGGVYLYICIYHLERIDSATPMWLGLSRLRKIHVLGVASHLLSPCVSTTVWK